MERCVTFDAAALEARLPIQPGDTAELQLDIWAALSFISPASPSAELTASTPSTLSASSEPLQFVLRMDYSGGPGLLQNYYRLMSIGFFIEVLPSVAIVRWSILSAEEPEQF